MSQAIHWAPPAWGWGSFAVLVLAMLALDLGLGSRQHRTPTVRAAVLWSGVWIGLGLRFGLVVLAIYGREPALRYYTAYLLEKSLSVDNVFVFALIFRELAIPAAYQRRVLSWGILGALAMR